jgi:hypothetical protein
VELQRAQSSVLNRIQPKLIGEMMESLREPIGLEELTKAVKSMAKGKAPGPDGIIAEFYQSLWPEIGRDYWQMIQKQSTMRAFRQGLLQE